MTSQNKTPKEDKSTLILEEICENTRAIRRVTNRILDHLHEYVTGARNDDDSDEDDLDWDNMSDYDDMYL